MDRKNLERFLLSMILHTSSAYLLICFGTSLHSKGTVVPWFICVHRLLQARVQLSCSFRYRQLC